MRDWLARLAVALRLINALAVEASKLAAVGQSAVLPPESELAPVVKIEGAEFEVRLHVKRVR